MEGQWTNKTTDTLNCVFALPTPGTVINVFATVSLEILITGYIRQYFNINKIPLDVLAICSDFYDKANIVLSPDISLNNTVIMILLFRPQLVFQGPSGDFHIINYQQLF